ncbi:TonB-dependent receptor [Colwellia sp. KU-HH00111]|uniref:TonB-dependent receptor n=1 Tax=Colwellia sp. KU-HH00111 TaxID=3127652 RepID=UPI0033658BD5
MNHKVFTKTRIATSLSLILSATAALPALSAEEINKKQDDQVEIIEVRGIRGSLVQSVDMKRNAIGVTESISADDIGKMPDQNIAESLQRLTGIQIDRNAGEGTTVRIRGMSNNLTVLNNESFLTGMEYFQLGEGRAEFQDSLEGVPAEVLGGVDVYKTPKASLIEGGVGGVVNLRTRSPFSVTEGFIAGNVKADMGQDADQWKPQATVAVGNSWDSFAAIATLSTNSKVVHSDQAQNINRQGWVYNQTAMGENYILPGMQYESDREYSRDRIGATLALGWRPSDDLEVNLDIFHNELDVDSREYAQKYAMAIDGALDESKPYSIDSNGVIKNATFKQNAGETNAAREITHITADNIKLSFDYYLDDWRFDGNITVSQSELNKEAAFADSRYSPYGVAGFIGADAASGNGSGTIIPNTVTGDDGDRSYEFTGGNGLPGISFLNHAPLQEEQYQFYKSHWGFADTTENDAISASLNAEYDIDAGDVKTIKFGARLANNEVDFAQGRYLTNLSQNGAPASFDPTFDYGFNAGIAAPDGHNLGDVDGDGVSDNQAWGPMYYYLDAAIGNTAFDATTSSGENLFQNLHGVGGWMWGGSPSTMPIATFTSDPSRGTLVDGWFPSGGSVSSALFQDTSKMGNPQAWLSAISGGAPVSLHSMPLESWNVEVKTSALYAEADLEGDDTPYKLNIGVRAVHTEVTVKGAQASPQTDDYWGTHTWNGTYKTWSNTSQSTDYWDLLPSANFSYDLDDKQIIRASFARVMSRPSNQSLGRGFGTEFVRNDQDQYVFSSGSAGNPDLEPFRANQLDVSYEWYMDELSYLAAGIFYKDVESFIVNQTNTEFVADDSDAGESGAGVTRPFNGDGGSVQGFEFALQKGFENGLGVIVNYTYSDSSTDQNSLTKDNLALPGISKHAYNIIGFYENNGINARIAYSWRDEYLSPDNTFISIAGLTDQFGDSDRPLANYYSDYGQLDASISYDINENFTLTAEAINITGENQSRYAEWKNLFRSFSSGEARYIVGASFRF